VYEEPLVDAYHSVLTGRQAQGKAPEDLEGALRQAQQNLLNARTLYTLRNRITENVLTTDPTLKAVHSGQNATIAERYV
jgi:hypothetical protein